MMFVIEQRKNNGRIDDTKAVNFQIFFLKKKKKNRPIPKWMNKLSRFFG